MPLNELAISSVIFIISTFKTLQSIIEKSFDALLAASPSSYRYAGLAICTSRTCGSKKVHDGSAFCLAELCGKRRFLLRAK